MCVSSVVLPFCTPTPVRLWGGILTCGDWLPSALLLFSCPGGCSVSLPLLSERGGLPAHGLLVSCPLLSGSRVQSLTWLGDREAQPCLEMKLGASALTLLQRPGGGPHPQSRVLSPGGQCAPTHRDEVVCAPLCFGISAPEQPIAAFFLTTAA